MNRILIALAALLSFSSMGFAADNMATNGSVATDTVGWQHDVWGNAKAELTYAQDDGCTDKASLFVDSQKFAEGKGDAKWLHDPVSVTPGTMYHASVCYKGNVESVLVFLAKDGEDYSREVAAFGSSPATNEWKTFEGDFKVPPGVIDVKFGLVPLGVGKLFADDFTLMLKE